MHASYCQENLSEREKRKHVSFSEREYFLWEKILTLWFLFLIWI